MKEETGITVLGALGIIAAVVLAGLLIWHLQKQQKPGPKPGPPQDPNGSE
jgi:heme A synthase